MSDLFCLFLVSALYLGLGVWVIRKTSESSTGKAQTVPVRTGRDRRADPRF
jgi:hypothetical protein